MANPSHSDWPPDEPNSDAVRDCARLVAIVRDALPTELRGRELSPIAKSPYKAALLDAGLSYRVVELAEATLEAIHSYRFVAAVVLARAVLETAAVHFYAVKKVGAALDERTLLDCDEVLYRALVGSKAYGDGSVQPIQVLTAIDHVNKSFEHYRDFYDQLSELAHPNWFGAHGAYAGENETDDFVQFHPDHAPGVTAQEPARGASLGLHVLQYSRRRLASHMPQFVRVCEAHINAREA